MVATSPERGERYRVTERMVEGRPEWDDFVGRIVVVSKTTKRHIEAVVVGAEGQLEDTMRVTRKNYHLLEDASEVEIPEEAMVAIGLVESPGPRLRPTVPPALTATGDDGAGVGVGGAAGAAVAAAGGDGESGSESSEHSSDASWSEAPKN